MWKQLVLYLELPSTTMSARLVSTIAFELTGSTPVSLDANFVVIQFLRLCQGRQASTEVDHLGSKGLDLLEDQFIADQVSKPCSLLIYAALFKRAVLARRVRTGPAR